MKNVYNWTQPDKKFFPAEKEFSLGYFRNTQDPSSIEIFKLWNHIARLRNNKFNW